MSGSRQREKGKVSVFPSASDGIYDEKRYNRFPRVLPRKDETNATTGYSKKNQKVGTCAEKQPTLGILLRRRRSERRLVSAIVADRRISSVVPPN